MCLVNIVSQPLIVLISPAVRHSHLYSRSPDQNCLLVTSHRQDCGESGNWQQLSNRKIALIAWALFRSEPGT